MQLADARPDTDFSDRVLRRLAAAAPRTVFSYPLRNGDCLLRPSPLLLHLPVGTVHHGPSQAPANLIRKSAGELETIEDISGPPLAEAGELSGGTTILKDQALCPFRAFAHHRLNARGLRDPGTGIDPSLRGILLHAVLEEFWGRTRSWEKLVSLAEGELDRLVAEAIETALTPINRRTVRPLTAPLLEIEKERLCLLVREWLTEVEAKRTPFTVMELEREHQENFGGVSFRTRVDRIDELPDGDRLILDYTTGRFDLNDLLAERPLEPPLPFYGVGEGDGRLAGVGVAILRRGECGLKGVARKDDILPRTAAFDGSRPAEKHGLEGWPSLLERWRAGLESLGQEFARGEAAVAPVDLQKACRYCDLGGFCRIDEASQPPRPEEGDEE
ncbi:MAG: PD-(D/E)XK nuclease family protein [Desulfuromonadales bacterium]